MNLEGEQSTGDWAGIWAKDHEKLRARIAELESKVKQLEAEKEAAFWQGWAVMAAFVVNSHDEPSIVTDAARAHGATLELLEKSKVDDFDLDFLREALADAQPEAGK